MGSSLKFYCSPLCGGWTRAHRPIRHGIIATLADLVAHFGADDARGLNRRLYKDTACGASISLMLPDGEWLHNGLNLDGWAAVTEIRGFTIQTIVEGSDATVDSSLFELPVKAKDVSHFVQQMENEAARLWDEANVEPDDTGCVCCRHYSPCGQTPCLDQTCEGCGASYEDEE